MKRVVLLLACFAQLPAYAATAIHWSYEGQGSPEHWADLGNEYQVCKTGQYQSPIDVKQVIDGKLPPLGMNFHTDTQSIVNNGHTIQVTVKDSDDFQLDNEAFILKQFHFHAPSENHLFNQSFPLEAHFVHANAQGELAVVAVMFKTGAENKTLAPLIAAFPAEEDRVEIMKQRVDLASFFPSDRHYYRFSGSLTTPPCTEGVRWLIMKQPVTLSTAQLAMFQQALKHANNRPLQPLHGRIIVE